MIIKLFSKNEALIKHSFCLLHISSHTKWFCVEFSTSTDKKLETKQIKFIMLQQNSQLFKISDYNIIYCIFSIMVKWKI
jgi:hypothetical protein